MNNVSTLHCKVAYGMRPLLAKDGGVNKKKRWCPGLIAKQGTAYNNACPTITVSVKIVTDVENPS